MPGRLALSCLFVYYSRYISSKDCFPVGFPLDGKPPRTLGCTPEHLRILFQPFFKGLDHVVLSGKYPIITNILPTYDISVKNRALGNMLWTAAREAWKNVPKINLRVAKQQKQNTLPLRNPQTTFVFSLKCKKNQLRWWSASANNTRQMQRRCIQIAMPSMLALGPCPAWVLLHRSSFCSYGPNQCSKDPANQRRSWRIAEGDSSTSFFAERFPIPPKGSCAFQTDWTMIGSRDRSVFHLARPTTQRNSQQPKNMQPSTTSQHAREGGNHQNQRTFDELWY